MYVTVASPPHVRAGTNVGLRADSTCSDLHSGNSFNAVDQNSAALGLGAMGLLGVRLW